MYKITDTLATHALGEIQYPLPKEKLETGHLFDNTDFVILDCRDLLDEPNERQAYLDKLNEAEKLLQENKKIVVFCGAGLSRSPAIAIAILTKFHNMSFHEAYNLVHTKVPDIEIESCHIKSLAKILNINLEDLRLLDQ